MSRSRHKDRIAHGYSIATAVFLVAGLVVGMSALIAVGSRGKEDGLYIEQECSMASPPPVGLNDDRSDSQKDFYRKECQ